MFQLVSFPPQTLSTHPLPCPFGCDTAGSSSKSKAYHHCTRSAPSCVPTYVVKGPYQQASSPSTMIRVTSSTSTTDHSQTPSYPSTHHPCMPTIFVYPPGGGRWEPGRKEPEESSNGGGGGGFLDRMSERPSSGVSLPLYSPSARPIHPFPCDGTSPKLPWRH